MIILCATLITSLEHDGCSLEKVKGFDKLIEARKFDEVEEQSQKLSPQSRDGRAFDIREAQLTF